MSVFKNYDPAQHVFVFNGILFTSFAEGTVLTVARTSRSFTTKVGAFGHVVRTRNRDKTGTFTATLLRAGAENALLSAMLEADELGLTVGAGVGPAMLKDLNGTTVAEASKAWIEGVPDVEVAVEHPNVQWVIACADLRVVVGGALL